MELDRFSFLRPWTLLLPERGACVLMAVGSGGKTTLFRALHSHFTERKRRVAWCALSEHPEPLGVPAAADLGSARTLLGREGSVFLGWEVAASEVESVRRELRPDVFLVEGGVRADGRFQPHSAPQQWPTTVHQLFCVAPLHAVGRPWIAKHVAGAPQDPERDATEIRRVTTDDVLRSVQQLAENGLPVGALVVPFLSGFGGYRDMDGMFAVVSELCGLPGSKAVCLAELLGDERRDAADRSGLPEGSPALSFLEGERVYCVYPSELDA